MKKHRRLAFGYPSALAKSGALKLPHPPTTQLSAYDGYAPTFTGIHPFVRDWASRADTAGKDQGKRLFPTKTKPG